MADGSWIPHGIETGQAAGLVAIAAGTLIETPNGPRAIETLEPGDRVLTEDSGAQPVRWVGRQRLRAAGASAPVKLAPGALGDHDALCVAPHYRLVVSGAMAELFFGEDEVLVRAGDLVNDQTIRVTPGGWIDYVHLLLDRHQILHLNGARAESLHPDAIAVPCGGLAGAAAARLCLTRHEALVLASLGKRRARSRLH